MGEINDVLYQRIPQATFWLRFPLKSNRTMIYTVVTYCLCFRPHLLLELTIGCLYHYLLPCGGCVLLHGHCTLRSSNHTQLLIKGVATNTNINNVSVVMQDTSHQYYVILFYWTNVYQLCVYTTRNNVFGAHCFQLAISFTLASLLAS